MQVNLNPPCLPMEFILKPSVRRVYYERLFSRFARSCITSFGAWRTAKRHCPTPGSQPHMGLPRRTLQLSAWRLSTVNMKLLLDMNLPPKLAKILHACPYRLPYSGTNEEKGNPAKAGFPFVFKWRSQRGSNPRFRRERAVS